MGQVSIPTQISIVILAIFVTIAFPLFVLSFLPIYFLRYLTSLLKRLLRPDLGKLLNARSCIFVVDDLYKQPLSTLVAFSALEGQLSIDYLRENFRQKLLKEDQNRLTSPSYPELLQFPSTWMGFPVWIPEANFTVAEHIKHYDGPVPFDCFSESIVSDVANELSKRPFKYGKSPWELYVFPNYQMDGDANPEISKCAILLRVHHSLADGFSLLKLFQLVGNGILTIPAPNSVRRNFVSKFLHFVTFLFRIPYDFAYTVILNSDPYGPWHLPISHLVKEHAGTVTPKIALTYLKTIRDSHKVTTTGIIMTVITGALRRIMIESGKGVPESICSVMPLPVPGHPDKLRNHLAAVLMSLPVGTEHPLDRLRIIEHKMKSLRKSTFPTTMFYLSKIIGALYPSMIRIIARHRNVSMVFSNFPGPTTQTRFLDLPVLDSMFAGGLSPGIGMGVCTISSNGTLRMILGINDAILPDGDVYVKRFTDHILLELDELLLSGGGI